MSVGIEKEEKILRKHLNNDQMAILIQNDMLHLVVMSMRMLRDGKEMIESIKNMRK